MNNIQENIYEAEVIADPSEIEEIKSNASQALTVADFTAPAENMMYCSLKSDGTMKSKAAIFNAVNSPEKRVSDCIGDVINLKDIVAHPVKLVDEKTGELLETMRMVLISDAGVGYEAVSTGLVNAVQRILQIFGQPESWTEPIPVKVVQKGTRNGNNKVTTLKIEYK